MLDALENLRHRDDLGEDRTLVDQVGQAPRAGLVSELGSGLAAFLLPQRFHAVAQLGQHRRRNEARQHQIAQLVQLFFSDCASIGLSG